ncbi:hypothetical protein GCM10007916_23660 [Psychromonas marina]|uniref:Response regulatory domain-containing protein n=1 Tax=Psychromonas marina TaxID=88364 RepID=A0ABQ6E1H2_9GAMM|nr:response regulator [Psychromonas marina]GLS91297.1 hypothetical protein GCM10007916_23660 [Psychromonas marina]
MLFWKSTKKILIIDDDRTLLRRLSIHLEKNKELEIIVSDNATEGLAVAQKIRPNLIILDWMLPDIQGIDLLATLKNSKKTNKIPVIMLTGRNKIGNIEDAFERGADDYMVKPFSLQKLAEKSFFLMK